MEQERRHIKFMQQQQQQQQQMTNQPYHQMQHMQNNPQPQQTQPQQTMTATYHPYHTVVPNMQKTQTCGGFMAEQDMKTKKFTVLLMGTNMDFIHGKPIMRLDPAVFFPEKNKMQLNMESSCMEISGHSMGSRINVTESSFRQQTQSIQMSGVQQNQCSTHVLMKSVKLCYGMNTAPFPVNITISQNSELPEYLNTPVCDGNNAKNKCFLTLPPNSKLDHMNNPVVIVGFDKVAKSDMSELVKYTTGYTSTNVTMGIMRADSSPGVNKPSGYCYVDKNHPLVHEICIWDTTFTEKFKQQELTRNLMDGMYRISDEVVSKGIELVLERLKRSPEVNVSNLEFHAVCSMPDSYREMAQNLNPECQETCHQVHMTFEVEYKVM